MSIPLACPKCTNILSIKTNALFCQTCQSEWPVVDGIPQFIKESYYWGEIPQVIMQQVNTLSRDVGWHQALETLVAKNYPDIYTYVTNHNRADFGFYTLTSSDNVVLDVGSGWGTISCLLAKRCGNVISLESVPERLEFLKIRAEQEGLANIQPVQASFLELPIPESSLDLAVLNGVLEWVGIASDKETPDQLQQHVLEKIFTCLKPGGSLYIGIENRFAYPYFLGAKDHSDLPFTSLAPRWLANWIMYRKTQKARRTTQSTGAYRTYTYSYWGYRALLRKSGFKKIQIYIVLPDYNNPAYIIPADNPQAFSYVIRQLYSGNSYKRKLIQAIASRITFLGFHRVFAPCFSIFATKEVSL
jgi:ubiquinone/menaquinone biosynthesis C-methylase UbiE